jgi:hypothetical protein
MTRRAGLLDRRLKQGVGQADSAQEVERLHRERCSGFTVKRFHEHMVKDHGFGWGHTWTKLHLQWAALEAKVPHAPIIQAFTLYWRDMLRVVCMALMNVIAVVAAIFGAAYAVQPAYGIGFSKAIYLWIPVLGNICNPPVKAALRRGFGGGGSAPTSTGGAQRVSSVACRRCGRGRRRAKPPDRCR